MERTFSGLFAIIMISLIIFSCGNDYTPEEKEYIKSIENERAEKDEYMKNSPDSPFNFKGKVEFHPLQYFEVDPAFVFKSKLTAYDTKDTVSIFGTKGDERKIVRFGNVEINYNGKKYPVNVYQGETKIGFTYYSIWFTDKTTGGESYGVGRYLDFELNSNPNFEYTIDFNRAYSPYCAYSKDYSCAIPRKEDHIDIAITAGEKSFHD